MGLHVEPGLTRVIGIHEIVDSADERERLAAAYTAHLERIIEGETREGLPRLRELLAPHLDGAEVVDFVPLTSLIAPGLAKRVFPEIFERVDRDGLVPLASLVELHPGDLSSR